MKFASVSALTLVVVATATATTVDFRTFGTGAGPSFVSGGLTVTSNTNGVAWAPSVIEGQGGIGVIGAGSQGLGLDASHDPGERINFDFGSSYNSIVFSIWDVTPVGNVELFFDAYDGATNLGTFAVDLLVSQPQDIDVSAIMGGLSASRIEFSLGDSAPIGLIYQSVTFVPAPGSLALLGTMGLLARRRR